MALLELDHVRKRFGQILIAEDVCLSVEAGAAVGIVGPNGAGKTTLFAIVSGDLAPDGGRVLLDGRPVTRLDSAARCRLGVGRTYQVPRPFEGMTVFENVLLGAQQGTGARGRAAHSIAVGVLERTGLRADANRPAGQLGLLARKRLEMARALATGPRLLLLDEVAGGLTEPEVDEVVALVAGARSEGIAVVWIEHVVRALLASVERLICLAGGRVLVDGPPAEVVGHQAVREVYFGGVAPTTATLSLS
ncbi:MAG: ABC transporter ATP-binding protein [Acidimicrobiales bacterium]